MGGGEEEVRRNKVVGLSKTITFPNGKSVALAQDQFL